MVNCSMEKPTSLAKQQQQSTVFRLPPGFRFHPTDEELVVQYLKRKVFSCPLPAAVIPEIDIGKYNPWDLPGGNAQERYFFVVRETKYPNGSRANRATGSGYWKATGRDRPIVASKFNQTVGMKKTLVFYQGKPPTGLKTDWIMHEYRLAGSETRACVFPQRKNSTHSPTAATRDWVLCRVFMKKKAIKTDSDQTEEFHEGRRAIGSPSSPSNSQSSCVTELSDGPSNGEDISSPP